MRRATTFWYFSSDAKSLTLWQYAHCSLGATQFACAVIWWMNSLTVRSVSTWTFW